ncbi:MAG: hypothetical protein KDK70_25285, partial [Myxococcales bacterium]|nr:hypothetical protein [Myxococcales bacterium]
AVGGAMFGLFYLGGTLAAATNLDDLHDDGRIDPSERDDRRVARLSFVPIIGPIVAAPMGSTRGDQAALVGHGILQGLAAATLVAGGVRLARDRRARRLAISAGPMAGGSVLSVRGRF